MINNVKTETDISPWQTLHCGGRMTVLASAKRYFSSILLLVLSITSFAQSPSQVVTQGTAFWVAFIPNEPLDSCDNYYLAAIPQHDGTLIVENPRTGWADTMAITANRQNLYQVPCQQVYISISGSPSHQHDAALLVRSSAPTLLYAYNRSSEPTSMDAALVYPVETLGQRYCISNFWGESFSGDPHAACAIVATEDTTHLTVNLTTNCNNNTAGPGRYYYTLHRGQVVYFQGTYPVSLSYSTISSDKAVAVFEGNTHAMDSYATDHVYNQALPISAWGFEYVAIPFPGDQSNRIMFLIDEETTTVNYHSGVASLADFDIILNRNVISNFILYNPTVLTSPVPLSVHQYFGNRGTSSGGGARGDAAGTTLMPTSSSVQYAHIPHFEMDSSDGSHPQCHINIATHTADTSRMRLDGTPLHGFSTIPGTNYSYLQLQVSADEHVLTSCAPDGFTGFFCGKSGYDGCYLSSFGGVPDTVVTPETIELTLTGCDTVYFLDSAYTETGTYLVDNGNCEESYLLHVTVGHTDSVSLAVELTNQEYQGPDGNTYSHSTDTTFVLARTSGCDSIVNLHLVIHHIDTLETDTTHCGPIIIEGVEYDHSGDIMMATANGYDTTYHLIHLTIYPTYDTTQYYVLDYDSLLWIDGNWYATSTSAPRVTYTTVLGCDSIIRLNLTVHSTPNIWLPNIFSPDQQTNNRFAPQCIGIRDWEIWIYNRAGLLVWHSTDCAEEWDGTHNGTPVPIGTYVYKIRYSILENPDVFQNKIGTVTLIR